VGIHIIGVFLLVHKHTQIVKLSFEHQRLEKKHQALLKEKQHIEEQLLAACDRTKIKEFAQKHLGMNKMKLNQIRSVPS
jgi:hypothetical protein